MECNREEAIRAKELAEKKMETKDFMAARRIVIKAQQLYPSLENISQMQAVCDVHCSAEHKVAGTETDWYGVLQIQQTADETTIKKQYRKLALLLHPDKNKFPGAEAAFKLIGEAQRLLSDPTKRRLHDMKRTQTTQKTALPKQSQPPASRNSHAGKQPGVPKNHVSAGTAQFTTMNPHQQKQQQQAQPGVSNQQTFWTSCPYCSIRYQYYRNIVNRALRCQNCLKTFVAYDLDARGMPQGATNPPFVQNKEGPSRDGQKIGPESTVRNFSFNTGSQGSHVNMEKVSQPKTGGTSSVGGDSKMKVKEEVNVRKEDGKEGKEIPVEPKPSKNTNRKRGRKSGEESSESCDTESSTDIENDIDHVTGFTSGDNPRRSSRQKQQVRYNEGASDDENIGGSSKRTKQNIAPDATRERCEPSTGADFSRNDKPLYSSSDFKEDKVEKQKVSASLQEGLPNGNEKTEECKKNGKQAVSSDDDKGTESANESEPDVVEVPDPDFYDFDRDKKEECFAVDQMWAVYDDLDGMPRFYAIIRKVFPHGFRVRITWLEPFSYEQEEVTWINAKLPVACCKYRHEKTEETENIGMFSHRVEWEKGTSRGSYGIYPRKGETWALFKNWNIKWSSRPDNHRKYEYEFVEVLSDYNNEAGICVAYLVKIKGFVSLFKPTAQDQNVSFQIPPKEMLRFAHRVPSFRTNGTEREDVPKGYYELDPASLPANMEEMPDSVDVNAKRGDVATDSKSGNQSPFSNGCNREQKTEDISGTREKESGGSDQVKSCGVSDAKDSGARETASSSENMDPHELPETVFYNFEGDKSHDKFQSGQIWALYCDLDALPKFYAQIKRVELTPDFKLNIRWLESSSLPKNAIQWLDKGMPICSGTFASGDNNEFNDTAAFSHQSRGVTTCKKNKFEIYPRKGEVWALYKNFNSEWSCSDLNKCEYEIVEVLQEKVSTIQVSVLQQVSGYETVFRSESEAGQGSIIDIPRVELLRFSHQVPAFRLTEEGNGRLQGCLELDPKALPVDFFNSK